VLNGAARSGALRRIAAPDPPAQDALLAANAADVERRRRPSSSRRWSSGCG
jgi:hypothetical protein